MLPEWQPQAYLNLFRMNDCAELDNIREDGLFQVRYNGETAHFHRIIPAFKFYLTIQAEASLYDVTDGEQLLEAKRYLKES
jgi:hypothetical protein